jgi:hypothetical protein
MSCILLFLILWTQGVPVQPTQGGTITGVLKDSAGKPAVGIRVGAVPRPDSLEELNGNTGAMSSLSETDEQGRFILENVPPGRYIVAAGVLNFPTYYPGTQAMAEGKIITVTAGGTSPGIDFMLKDSSGGRIIGTSGGQNSGGFAIPLDIRVENGAKIPVFGGGKVTGVRATPLAGGNAVTATVIAGSLPLQDTIANYIISVEGLPDGYTVKSMKYGSTEMKDGILTLAAVPAIAPNAMPTAASATADLLAYLNGIRQGRDRVTAAALVQTLSIVLSRSAPARVPGVNITGQFPPAIRGAFLSGVSAAIYLDQSFEFSGVRPGRYALTAFGSNSNAPFAASIIVGDKDISGIELEPTSVLPVNARTPTPPGPAGNRAPGRLPLASVRGKIVDAETGDLLTQGDVYLVGDYWTGKPLTADSKFEFRSLLPGKYQIEVKAVGYPTFRQEFAIEEQDLELEVKSK